MVKGSQGNDRANQLNQWKYLVIIAILVSIVLILASLFLGSINFGHIFNVPVLLSSLGYSILASTVFAFLFKSKTDEYVEKKLVNDIRNNIEDKLTELFSENKLLHDECPTKVFPPSDTPHSDFDKLVDTNIGKATFYRSKGTRALYLSYRLKERVKKTTSLQIEVILFGMTNLVELRHRAKIMKDSSEYAGKTLEQIETEMKRELLSVLVAFYDIRQQHDFTIYFSGEVSPFRFEIMDDLLVVSASMQRSKQFPTTFTYAKGSAFYNSYIMYFDLQKKLLSGRQTLTSQNISTEKILNLAKELDCTFTIPELRAFYEAKHRRYKT